MKIGPYIGCAVLVMVFGSAILGMLIRRKLPESHLSDESKGVVTLSMGVVGTLTALVLSLLIATASGTFNARNQEIAVIAAIYLSIYSLPASVNPVQRPPDHRHDRTRRLSSDSSWRFFQ